MEASRAFAEAQRRAKALSEQMKAAAQPSAKLAAEYKKAQTAVSAASAAMQKQSTIFRSTRTAVESFGTSIGKIAQAERALKANVDSVTAALRRQEVALGLPGKVSPHTLRHTAATWLMQNGVEIWEAAGFLGMSPKLVEDTYGHHHPDHLKGAARGFRPKK